ncbi:uncharacterized protein LOC112906355 [Agrilus planipennis]|uniref:Uncharacterized protein LOC112906355 n=1 Tax=Agrilus planipennis TaxID=224129 RepID=A0A7F5RJF4_AGRPL|nr:uncharacterized protein LOC112906355 [Agrilus planipennis]
MKSWLSNYFDVGECMYLRSFNFYVKILNVTPIVTLNLETGSPPYMPRRVTGEDEHTDYTNHLGIQNLFPTEQGDIATKKGDVIESYVNIQCGHYNHSDFDI